MASKKRAPKYTLGPEHTYWPVYEDGRVIALCPSNSIAQSLAALLALGYAAKKKHRRSSETGSDTKP